MIAITNKMWINPPAAYANVPIAHPIIRITAIMYKIDLMVFFLMVDN